MVLLQSREDVVAPLGHGRGVIVVLVVLQLLAVRLGKTVQQGESGCLGTSINVKHRCVDATPASSVINSHMVTDLFQCTWSAL